MNFGHRINIDLEFWSRLMVRLDTAPAGSGHSNHLVPYRSGNVNLFVKFDTPTSVVSI